MNMRQHLPEVPHVNARPAYRAIAEMIGLGLGNAVSVDAGIVRDHELIVHRLDRRFVFRLVAARRPRCIEQNTSIGFIGDEPQ